MRFAPGRNGGATRGFERRFRRDRRHSWPFTASTRPARRHDDVLDARFRNRNLRLHQRRRRRSGAGSASAGIRDSTAGEQERAFRAPGARARAVDASSRSSPRWFSRVPEEGRAARADGTEPLAQLLEARGRRVGARRLRALPGLRVLDLTLEPQGAHRGDAAETARASRRRQRRFPREVLRRRDRRRAEDVCSFKFGGCSRAVSFPRPPGDIVGGKRTAAASRPRAARALVHAGAPPAQSSVFRRGPASVEDRRARASRGGGHQAARGVQELDGLVDAPGLDAPELARVVSEKEGDPSRPPRSIPEQDFGVGRRRTVRTRGSRLRRGAVRSLER